MPGSPATRAARTEQCKRRHVFEPMHRPETLALWAPRMLLPDLRDAELRRELGRLLRLRRLTAGQTLFFEGEEARAVYVVSAGVLRAYSAFPDGRRQIHRFVRAGEMIGLTFGAIYPYNSDAVGNAAVLTIERDRLDEFCGTSPDFARLLLARLSKEADAARELSLLLGRSSARERLAGFLLQWAGSWVAGRDGEAAPRLTQRDLADHLGLSVETVCRELRHLVEARMMSYPRPDRIQVNDAMAMRRIADGSAGAELPCACSDRRSAREHGPRLVERERLRMRSWRRAVRATSR